jgi:hypothetical protein
MNSEAGRERKLGHYPKIPCFKLGIFHSRMMWWGKSPRDGGFIEEPWLFSLLMETPCEDGS